MPNYFFPDANSVLTVHLEVIVRFEDAFRVHCAAGNCVQSSRISMDLTVFFFLPIAFWWPPNM